MKTTICVLLAAIAHVACASTAASVSPSSTPTVDAIAQTEEVRTETTSTALVAVTSTQTPITVPRFTGLSNRELALRVTDTRGSHNQDAEFVERALGEALLHQEINLQGSTLTTLHVTLSRPKLTDGTDPTTCVSVTTELMDLQAIVRSHGVGCGTESGPEQALIGETLSSVLFALDDQYSEVSQQRAAAQASR